jgi:hypothetical protein
LSSKFQLSNVFLEFSCFNEQHFADKIAKTIHSKLERLGAFNNVTAVTYDVTSNMKKAFKKFTNIDRIWCLKHRLNSIITNALGFSVRIAVPGCDDDMDSSSKSDVIDDELTRVQWKN